ncbi:hypothetical protein [Flavobacterium pectinovorum]|uniref:Uncharacterized protein n=1 Tax=Flavobacterium pectinovorum TaxID=29533 RepID=A0AB36NXT9_9FLAO|nr:hypothetical protein [Flavobacterium pectinovorum]OXB02451.1 hypothetical protein B0A72_17550 [Flavobacterium pectinovorum]SHM33751.1 hypothetical protein SAMN05444387_2239 [Flavobacterium pectinovorum]
MDKYNYFSILRNINENIDDMNVAKFLRAESLGKESLIAHKDLIEQFNNTLKSIIANMYSFSKDTIEEIYNFYNELTVFYSEVNGMNNVEFINSKTSILLKIENFSDKFNSFYEKISGILNVSYENKNLDEYIETINSVRNDIEKQSEEISQKINDVNYKSEEFINKLKEVDNIKNSVQFQLDEFRERYTPDNVNIELRNQQKVYEEEAKINRKESRNWIIAIVIAVIFLIILIWSFINNFDNHLNEICVCTFKNFNLICPSCGQEILWFYLIKHTLLRALLLSINIYILKFCIKNYNACKHNETINKQRQNSYGASLHFYNTIISDKKDEILIMAANSIFTHQKTGYIEKGSEPNNPTIDRVVEKVQEITKIPKD